MPDAQLPHKALHEGICSGWDPDPPGRKVERREVYLPRGLGPTRLPLQAPGDHEVNDEEELCFEREDQALAQSA